MMKTNRTARIKTKTTTASMLVLLSALGFYGCAMVGPQSITIRSSEKRPDDATVQIRFRGRLFYIVATDTRSKRAFVFLQTFIGMRLADPGAAQRAPVLTVPVN